MRIVIVDDQPMYRDAVAAILAREPDLYPVACGSTGREALAACREGAADLVVAASQLADVDALGLLRRLQLEMKAVRLIVLADAPDPERASALLLAGASAYLCRQASVADLLRAVRGNRSQVAATPLARPSCLHPS